MKKQLFVSILMLGMMADGVSFAKTSPKMIETKASTTTAAVQEAKPAVKTTASSKTHKKHGVKAAKKAV